MSSSLQTLSEFPIQQPELEKFAPLQLWDVITRNRYFILSGFAISLTVAALFAWLARPVYESSTTLRIDENKNGVPGLEVLAILSDKGSELSTEMQMLKSRTLAEATVDSIGLQVLPTTPKKIGSVRIPGFHNSIPRSSVFSYLKVSRTTKPA